jgi:hypothetical protein
MVFKIGSFGLTLLARDEAALENYALSLIQKTNQEQGEKMKKFVIFHYGYENPTPEIMGAWSKWFESLGDKMVDPGSPLGPGKEISSSGTKELPLGAESLTGYTVIRAASMDEAEKIAKSCPMIQA